VWLGVCAREPDAAAGRLSAMATARGRSERRPAFAGALVVTILEALIVLPLGVPVVRKAVVEAQTQLCTYGLDWLASSFAAPAWRTNATTVYVVGTILTAILTIGAVGALAYPKPRSTDGQV